MKLTLLKKTAVFKSTEPKISFSKKGTIYINSAAIKLFNLEKSSSRISIFIDEEKPQSIFIYIAQDACFAIKPKNSKKSSNDFSCQIYFKQAVNQIIQAYHHIGDNSLIFNVLPSIQHQGKIYYPLQVIKESIEMFIPNPNGPAK